MLVSLFIAITSQNVMNKRDELVIVALYCSFLCRRTLLNCLIWCIKESFLGSATFANVRVISRNSDRRSRSCDSDAKFGAWMNECESVMIVTNRYECKCVRGWMKESVKVSEDWVSSLSSVSVSLDDVVVVVVVVDRGRRHQRYEPSMLSETVEWVNNQLHRTNLTSSVVARVSTTRQLMKEWLWRRSLLVLTVMMMIMVMMMIGDCAFILSIGWLLFVRSFHATNDCQSLLTFVCSSVVVVTIVINIVVLTYDDDDNDKGRRCWSIAGVAVLESSLFCRRVSVGRW